MTKTISRTVDGATISATAAEALAPMVDSALDLFEEVRADWADGFVLWMGWCPLALRETDAGYLVMSPDLALDPRKDITADLSLALGTAVHLGAIPQRAGLEPQEIDFNNDVICTLDWESAAGLQLSRIHTTTPQDSGWFIQPFPAPPRAEDWRPDELVRLPVWYIRQRRPDAAHVMALPVGVTAVIDEQGVRALFREADGKVLMSRDD